MNSYPIVLAHGFARPDYLIHTISRTLYRRFGVAPEKLDRFHYFRGIAGHLREQGIPAYHAEVSFAAGLAQRAADLKTEVERIKSESGYAKVHIIGHSMGGLDARYMIAAMQGNVHTASLTTVGTPHLGSSLADWLLEGHTADWLKAFGRFLNLDGVHDLTRDACRQMNRDLEAAEAANDVFYQVYCSSQEISRIVPGLRKTAELIEEVEGDNDGLVAVTSQMWTDKLTMSSGESKTVRRHQLPFAADHVNQIGWWHPTGMDDLKLSLSEWRQRKRSFEEQIYDVYSAIARGVRS